MSLGSKNDSDMDPSQEETLERATTLRDEKRYRESAALLEPLAEIYPNNKWVWGVLAADFFLMDDYERSERTFRLMTERWPQWDIASVGLFHSLWELGRMDDAFDEARRFFIEGGKSKEYKRLFKEMVEELSARGVDTNAPEDE